MTTLTSSDAAAARQAESRNAGSTSPRSFNNVPFGELDISDILKSKVISVADLHEKLLALEAGHFAYDNDTARQICVWTLNQIHPSRILTSDGRSEVNEGWTSTGEIALKLLLSLEDTFALLNFSVEQITTLIFWSISNIIVIDQKCKDAAERLLSKAADQWTSIKDPKLSINTALLEQVVRPAFVHSRPKEITSAGRRAVDPHSDAPTSSEDDKLLKPWKFKQRYVVDMLTWVIKGSDAQSIENNWHLITPPVLTLLDDENILNKVRGCGLLQILLEKVPSKSWIRTGLGKVFQDALIPALSYLPPLTDQSDAEQLLEVIYPILLLLCNKQFSSMEQKDQRIKMLDEILRSGILYGLSYSGENVNISSLLLAQLSIILSEMGIQCVKHLKTLIPVLVGYLYDPFAFASPSLLQSTLKAMQSVITNAWPRMEQYCGETFKGIAVCWQRLSEESESSPILTTKGELRITMKLLITALGDAPTAEEIKNVIRGDRVLRDLLP